MDLLACKRIRSEYIKFPPASQISLSKASPEKKRTFIQFSFSQGLIATPSSFPYQFRPSHHIYTRGNPLTTTQPKPPNMESPPPTPPSSGTIISNFFHLLLSYFVLCLTRLPSAWFAAIYNTLVVILYLAAALPLILYPLSLCIRCCFYLRDVVILKQVEEAGAARNLAAGQLGIAGWSEVRDHDSEGMGSESGDLESARQPLLSV